MTDYVDNDDALARVTPSASRRVRLEPRTGSGTARSGNWPEPGEVTAGVMVAERRSTPTSSPRAVDQRPRRPKALFQTDYMEFLLAAIAGIALAMTFRLLLDWTHPLTLAIWAVIGFMVVEYLLVRDRSGSVVASDRLITCAVWLCGLAAVGVLAWMVVYLVAKGLGALDWNFFTEDMSKAGPLDPGGGSLHAIIGTLEQIGDRDRHRRAARRADRGLPQRDQGPARAGRPLRRPTR